MDVETAIRTTRSIRRFTPEAVAEDDLRAILDAGRRAQSSMNGQPWRFVVVRDRATLAALAACGRYAGHLAGAAAGIALVGTGADADMDLGQALAYLQLAARARGYGTCIASMWEPERAKAILGIPAELTFHTALSVGRPAPEELAPRPPKPGGRLPLEEVVRWERWG
jgi:nitroreductase